MSKIQMKPPLVEMDGDEMTRVIWAAIKKKRERRAQIRGRRQVRHDYAQRTAG